ncbi:MAG: O-antigen ligase family protein [Candidatus Omnitrophica bacterium]|nr:O-antigen ligase family protein [Candidatus Omnitrophota bacterium]
MLIVYLYFIAIFIRPQDWVKVFFACPIVDILIGIGLVAVFLSLGDGKIKVKFPALFFIIGYLIVIFLSNFAQGNFPAAVEFFLFHLKRAASFLVLIFLLNSTAKLKKAIGFFVFLAVLLVLQGMYQKVNGTGWAGQSLVQDVRICWVGMWDGPNVLALVFIIAAVFSLNSFLNSVNFLEKARPLIVFACLCYGIYLTNSRGGFVSLLACLFLSFLFKVKNKVKAIILGGLICLVVFTVAAPSRMANIQGESSAQERSWTWEVALTLARANPLFGIGKGMFYKQHNWYAHNNFVQVMVETGFTGLFLFISIMYISLKGLRKVYLISKDKQIIEKEPGLADIAKTIGIALIVFNVCTFFVTMELEILYILLAFCFAPLVIVKKYSADFKLTFDIKDFFIVSIAMVVLVSIVAVIAIKNLV